ncbi:MAG: phosphatase PAP2 family protein, partial [Candidatus Omnitrophica bacterium]|nr:phosphatase PAP2 family protein [Candidatus Omnitrophota bacterium]
MSQIPIKITSRAEPRSALWVWAVAFGLLTYQVARGHTVRFDHAIAQWVAALRSPALDGPMKFATQFGSLNWAVCGLLGVSLWAWRREETRASLPTFLAAFLIGMVMETVLKLTVPHWRPSVTTLPASMNAAMHLRLAGFPSGHAFYSACVFGWLASACSSMKRWWARWFSLGCVALIGLVGFTRLYLNRHWASDVLGSWLLTLLVLSIARYWERT